MAANLNLYSSMGTGLSNSRQLGSYNPALGK